MSRLVDDILNLALVEGEPFEPARVRLDEVVGAVATRLAREAESAAVELEVELPEGPVEIAGDRTQLESAVENLVGNAIKYTAGMHDDRGVVRVVLEPSETSVTLSVADNGIGIGREHVERVFERFYRVDPGRSRATGGTGLGLSIVRHVAMNHHGTIDVESALGQGSTFSLVLPNKPPADPEGV